MNAIREIASVLAGVDDEKLIERFLKSILTKSELKEIELRWELVKLLYDGMSQRKISEKLGVSLCKITRGSRELQKHQSAFREMIERHRTIKNEEQN
jgi:TrpR family trp operon transcriptional repressor